LLQTEHTQTKVIVWFKIMNAKTTNFYI
jgi:hypothetical protein